MAQGIEKIGTHTGCRGRLLAILAANPDGMILSQLIKQLQLPARTIKNNLTLLKASNSVIHNQPIWQIGTLESTPIKSGPLSPSSNTINLHNLSFVIKLIRKPFWWAHRTNKLLKLKDQQIKAIDTGRYIYHQLSKSDYAVQFHKNSIIVIIRKDYHGVDAFDCLIKGINDFLDIYTYISKLFEYQFFDDGIPSAMIRSQHTVKLYDAVAKRCRRSGDKFEVWHDGKLRMYIDSSHPTGIEAIQREHTTEDIDRYTRYVEDIIVNDPPKASELAHNVNVFLKAQASYAENIQAHIGAIQQLGGQMQRFNDLLERLEKKA